MSNPKETPSHHGVLSETSGQYLNETMRLLIERGSCRGFTADPIPEALQQQLYQAAIHSPTGGNLQPYSIIKIEDDAARQKLTEWCEQKFMADAPLHLLFCLDWHRLERWAELSVAPFSAKKAFRHFWISFQDTIIAAQNLCTAADAIGLGSVYIGTVMEYMREIRDLFALPDGVLPVVLLCVGFPEYQPKSRRKLGPNVIVHDERYRDLPDDELLAAFDDKYPTVKIEITDRRMEMMEQVCRDVHGDEFAQKCLAAIHNQGFINAVQRYFGLHYRANMMPGLNEDFLAVMREMGFEWFEA